LTGAGVPAGLGLGALPGAAGVAGESGTEAAGAGVMVFAGGGAKYA
jgi:hypothetical protein